MKQETLVPTSQEYDKTRNDSIAANVRRRLPIGAEVLGDGEIHFRVWARRAREVKVVIDGPAKHRAVVPLNAESDSYFSVGSAEAKAGDLYRYCLDGSGSWLPDPASPFQPEGPQGPSMIVEPREFAWHDHNWNGVKIERQVIYEMHIGTFTAGGTWLAARQQLRTLQSRRSSPGAASRKRGA